LTTTARAWPKIEHYISPQYEVFTSFSRISMNLETLGDLTLRKRKDKNKKYTAFYQPRNFNTDKEEDGKMLFRKN